jgi:hypothetical protein
MYDIPNNKRPEEKAPRIKYLIPASEDKRLLRFKEART